MVTIKRLKTKRHSIQCQLAPFTISRTERINITHMIISIINVVEVFIKSPLRETLALQKIYIVCKFFWTRLLPVQVCRIRIPYLRLRRQTGKTHAHYNHY